MAYLLLTMCGVLSAGYAYLAYADAPACTIERYARVAQCALALVIGATCFAALGMVN